MEDLERLARDFTLAHVKIREVIQTEEGKQNFYIELTGPKSVHDAIGSILRVPRNRQGNVPRRRGHGNVAQGSPRSDEIENPWGDLPRGSFRAASFVVVRRTVARRRRHPTLYYKEAWHDYRNTTATPNRTRRND